MSETFLVTVNEQAVMVRPGTTVAAAIVQVGAASRYSVSGEPRQPLCGMGICYECRVAIDGRRHQRSCQIACVPGMQVVTE